MTPTKQQKLELFNKGFEFARAQAVSKNAPSELLAQMDKRAEFIRANIQDGAGPFTSVVYKVRGTADVRENDIIDNVYTVCITKGRALAAA